MTFEVDGLRIGMPVGVELHAAASEVTLPYFRRTR